MRAGGFFNDGRPEDSPGGIEAKGDGGAGVLPNKISWGGGGAWGQFWGVWVLRSLDRTKHSTEDRWEKRLRTRRESVQVKRGPASDLLGKGRKSGEDLLAVGQKKVGRMENCSKLKKLLGGGWGG